MVGLIYHTFYNYWKLFLFISFHGEGFGSRLVFGNNLGERKNRDPSRYLTATELTLENAGDLASKAGIDLSVRAVCQPKFSELLKSMGVSVQRKDVIERDKILRVDDTNETPAPGGNGGGGNTGGGDNGGGDNGGGTTPPGGGGGVDQN